MPAAPKNPKAAEVGRAFKELRTRQERTIQEAAKESERRFGPSGALKVAQISRIENGNYGRMTMDDAVHLGQLYGLSPNQVAAMLGLYNEPDQQQLPPEFQDLMTLWPTLPFAVQEEVLSWLRMTLVMAKANAAKPVEA